MEGDPLEHGLFGHLVISIHTLRMEGDHAQLCRLHGCRQISIHTLRMEGDHAGKK